MLGFVAVVVVRTYETVTDGYCLFPWNRFHIFYLLTENPLQIFIAFLTSADKCQCEGK